ncbi:hypothetical protein SBRY_30202 [Actinacidiphila bryophytorum]|uniref:Uncharacterized protein n=1 Tax=Actinacidiphila bryophytorum TaxID=1436133 RepID=A0A9W4H0L8_9ACTN|nr:hypothetical protein SBRY_30202 [Actinacidiphila bryophytorum]
MRRNRSLRGIRDTPPRLPALIGGKVGTVQRGGVYGSGVLTSVDGGSGPVVVGCENSEMSKRAGGEAGAADEADSMDVDADERTGTTTGWEGIDRNFSRCPHHRALRRHRGRSLWKTPRLWITSAAAPPDRRGPAATD